MAHENDSEVLNRLAVMEDMLFSLHSKLESQQNRSEAEFQVFFGLLLGRNGKVKDELAAWERLKTIAQNQITIIKTM